MCDNSKSVTLFCSASLVSCQSKPNVNILQFLEDNNQIFQATQQSPFKSISPPPLHSYIIWPPDLLVPTLEDGVHYPHIYLIDRDFLFSDTIFCTKKFSLLRIPISRQSNGDYSSWVTGNHKTNHTVQYSMINNILYYKNSNQKNPLEFT